MNQSISYEVAGVMAQAIATGLFVSLCTIQAPSGTLGASGAPDGLYSNVSGLVSIPCMDAPQPPTDARFGVKEAKAPAEITAMANRHVLLNTYYPTLITGWRQGWRAVIDGVIYDLCGVEPDSQRQMVRLELELVSAGAVQP
jgi:hypothetical protein